MNLLYLFLAFEMYFSFVRPRPEALSLEPDSEVPRSRSPTFQQLPTWPPTWNHAPEVGKATTVVRMALRLRGRLLALLVLLAVLAVSASVARSEHDDSASELDDADGQPVLGLSGPGAPAGGALSQAEIDVADGLEEGWRELGKDEGVPIGSHVRMNVNAGRKFVKIDPDTGEPALVAAEEPSDAADEEGPSHGADPELTETAFEMMERVLGELPEPAVRGLPAKDKISPEAYQAAVERLWEERQAEIKEAMESVDKEGELVRNYTSVLTGATLETAPEALAVALVELEYLVTDIDLATYFVKVGGVEATAALFAHRSVEVRTLAAHVVGSCVKNAGELQAVALNAGVAELAVERLRQLLPCTGGPAEAQECAKFLYGVSSLARGHEPAQQRLLANGLVPDVVHPLLRAPGLDRRVLSKVVDLVNDVHAEWADYPPGNAESETCALLRGLEDADACSDPIVASKLADALTAAGCGLHSN